MKQRHATGTALCLVFLVLRIAGAQQHIPPIESAWEPVRALCNAGIESFNNARYDDAVANFRKAVSLAPGEKQPHLYLGMSYAYQVVPNLDTPENEKMASAALHEFEIVLKDDPHNLEALRQEAVVYRNIKELDEAKAIEKAVLTADPNDAEAYYTVGVIDWMQAYKNSVTVLATEHLTDDGIGNAKLSNAGCDTLEQKNAALVEDALASLGQAIRIRANYDDAMQYLNLIYRRRADLHCHDRTASGVDIALAQEWNRKALQARKENEALRLPR